MPVHLSTRSAARRLEALPWVAVDDGPVPLAAGDRLVCSRALEEAFDQIHETWWTIGRDLSREPSASLAHAPVCAPNASDFGLMLAWTRLVDDWSREQADRAVVCDDPWLYRHLASRDGVRAGPPPPVWPRAARFFVRGFFARLAATLRLAATSLALRRDRQRLPRGRSLLVAYAHPRSTPDGEDAYFGDLMRRLPGLWRALHVDGGSRRARRLAGDRTVSLHAFAGPFTAFRHLPFARWRPTDDQRAGTYGWLVRRAAALEGRTAQASMIRWQQLCQTGLLKRAVPRVVAWPWENHNWERALVPAARKTGARTVGYQHSVIGRQMLNYAVFSCNDGDSALPDQVICNGPATRDHLAHWGIPTARMVIGGALRYQTIQGPRWDRTAPVFMAVPFDGSVARQMVEAAKKASEHGLQFVVKDHPMTPFLFHETADVRRADGPLAQQPSASAVVYAATTVGLEAAIAGLPVVRFIPDGRIAIDILPGSVDVASADAPGLADTLLQTIPRPSVSKEQVFASVDIEVWARTMDMEDIREPSQETPA